MNKSRFTQNLVLFHLLQLHPITRPKGSNYPNMSMFFYTHPYAHKLAKGNPQ